MNKQTFLLSSIFNVDHVSKLINITLNDETVTTLSQFFYSIRDGDIIKKHIDTPEVWKIINKKALRHQTWFLEDFVSSSQIDTIKHKTPIEAVNYINKCIQIFLENKINDGDYIKISNKFLNMWEWIEEKKTVIVIE